MALITEQAQLRLSLEAQQAINQLSLLETSTKDLVDEQKLLQKQMKDAIKPLTANDSEYKTLNRTVRETKKNFGENSYEHTQAKIKLEAHTKALAANSSEYKKYENELKRVNTAIDANETKMESIRKEYGDVSRSTTSLLYEQKSLQKTMRDSTFESEAYSKALLRQSEIEQELAERERITGRKNGFGSKTTPKLELPSTANPISEFLGGLGGKIATLALLEQGLEAVWAGIQKGYASQRELSKATGATAARLGMELGSEELKNLVDTAQQMGDAFTKSTPDVLSAIQDIGSIRPELMKDSEALAQLADDALILAGADGLLSAKEAGEALAGSLNQWGEGADQSRRYINALAQSSKEGSAEINDLAGTFKVAGTTLANSNVSFEQGNALAQKLAEKMILGEQAGTNLRNIFSKLSVSADNNLNPSIVGLNTALDNLAKLSPQQIVKLFGEENQVAANIIIKERKEIDTLTKAITGTNYALEQFHAQTDNLNNDAEKFGHAWDGIFEDVGRRHESLFRSITQMGVNTLNYLRAFEVGFSFGEKDRTNGFYVTGYGDVKERKAIEDEYKRQQQTAVSDAKKVVSEYERAGNKNETILNKQLKGLNSVVSQSQAGISEVMNRYTQARKNNADKETIQAILNEKKYFEAKYKFARSEENRLKTNEKRKEETNQKILAGQEDDPKGKGKDKKKQAAEKAAKEAQQLLEERLQNEAKIIQELAKLSINDIQDEQQRKEAALALELSFASAAKLEEVQNKKLSQKSYDEWFEAETKDMNRKIKEDNDKVEEQKVKKAEETAKKLLDLTDRTMSLQLQMQLQKAEAKGDDFGAFNIKSRQLDFEREKELRNKELTEEQKSEIEKYYIERHTQLLDELTAKEKVKTEKINADTIQNELNLEKNLFKRHDLQIQLLNAQETAELQSAEKTGASIAGIHKKYAGLRKKTDEDLWKEIAQLAVQSFVMISDGFAQSRALDAQADQINLDNEKGRKIQSLDSQLKAGIITQKKYDEEKLKEEEKYNQKQKVIKRKQAEADHDAAVVKATQSAIQSILMTMTSVPYPFNIPLAAIQGVIAFDQVSKLAAMPIPEFYSGIENTGSGKQFTQANDGKGGFYAILHPNEEVLSKEGRIEKNNKLAAYDKLKTDYARIGERLREAQTINNTNIYNQGITPIYQQTQAQQSPQNPDNSAMLRLADTTNQLAEVLKGGIVAKNVWNAQDVNELDKKRAINDKLKNVI